MKSPLSSPLPFVLSNKGTKNDPKDEESDVSHIEMTEWWKWLPVCCLQVLGSQLRILSASPEDSGEYICRVQGNPGNPGSHVHQASVSVSVTSSSSRKLVNACRYHTGVIVPFFVDKEIKIVFFIFGTETFNLSFQIFPAVLGSVWCPSD